MFLDCLSPPGDVHRVLSDREGNRGVACLVCPRTVALMLEGHGCVPECKATVEVDCKIPQTRC